MDKVTVTDFMAIVDVGETETTKFCLLTLNAYVLEKSLQLYPKLKSVPTFSYIHHRLYNGRMILLLPWSSILKEAYMLRGMHPSITQVLLG